MRKNLLFATTLLLSVSQLLGQNKTVFDAEFNLSDEVKSKGFGFMTLGSDQSHIYSLSVKGFNFMMIPIGFKYILNKFDSKMSLVQSEKIPMKTDIYKLGMYKGMIDMKMIDNRIIQTVNTLDKKTDTRTIYLIEYDRSNLQQINTLEVGSFPEKGKQSNYINTFFDPKNNEEFAVIVQSSVNEQNSKATLFTIDSKLQTTLQLDFEIAGSYKNTSFSNYMITPDFVAFTCKTTKDKKEEDLSDKLDFYMIDRNTKNIQQFEISLRDIGNDISDFECAVDASGKLFISGFYSSGLKKSNDVGGVFTQIYNTQTGEKLNEDIHPFTFDFVTENMSEKQKKKTEKRMEKERDYDAFEYLVREVIPNNDGSSILVAERYRYYETTSTDSKGNTRTIPHYIHADLITVRTSKMGEIEWVERFKKFHHATDPASGQMLFHDTQKVFYVIFSEEAKLKMVQVNKENGESKCKDVYSKDAIGKYAPALGYAVQPSPTSYISQLVRLKKSKVLTVTFKK